MMKRLFAIFLIWTITIGVTLPCYAAGDSAERDVFAKFVSDFQWENASVKDGTAMITVKDGYTVTVTDIPSEAVILKVFSISSSETSAWEWISNCIGERYNVQAAFDIYFEDAGGNRMNVDDIQITIQSCDSNCVVFSVSTLGQIAILDSTNKKGILQFMADGSNYYILAKEVSALELTDLNSPGASDNPTASDDLTISSDTADTSYTSDVSGMTISPATGDNDHIKAYSILLITAGSFLVWLRQRLKKN